MERKRQAVCAVVVLLVVLGAVSSGMASSPLSTEDMSGLRGGCPSPQWYCIPATCGSSIECNGHPDDWCEPEGDYPCDNNKETKEGIEHCASSNSNLPSCVRDGSVEACGHRWTCICQPHVGEGFECVFTNPIYAYQYYPCS